MHHKRHVVLFGVCFGACLLHGFAQSEQSVESEALHRVRDLITQVDKEINAPLGEHFAMSQIFSEVKAAPSFCGLVSVTTNRWEQILDNWSVIAVNENARLIQEHALLFLPPEAYLSCLKRLLKLYEKGQVKKNELSMMLFRPENDKRWFLSYNYREPEIQNLLREVARVFATDKHIPNLVAFYASGKAKQRDAVLRNERPQEYCAKETLPLLPTSNEYESRSRDRFSLPTGYIPVAVILVLTSIGFLYVLRKWWRSK